jgi:hypothetical protein
MNLLLEILVRNGLLMDIAGVTGLGLVALAAARLARRHKSWGGNMIAIGALAVLLARVYLVLAPRLIDNEALVWMGPLGISLSIGLPPLCLTLGLAGIAFGLWAHERWIKEAG